MSIIPRASHPNWTRTSSTSAYTEFNDTTGQQLHDEDSPHICRTCAVDRRHQPIHCIQVAPYSSAPPSYRSVVSTASFDSIEPITPPRPLRPTLRLHVDGRPHVRFRRSPDPPLSSPTNAYDVHSGHHAQATGSAIPHTPQDDVNCRRRNRLGLGIPGAPFNPDANPVRSPDSEKLARAEEGVHTKDSPTNIAERIEKKLLEYTQSGNIAKRWLLEIICWTLSAVCMTAIIVVLCIYSGKPVPTHWVGGLTLNTYISIFSKIASAALLLPASEAIGQLKWSWFQGRSKKLWDFEIFDNASRGPWGSFMLLVRTKGTTLAALGAAIMIFAMGLDQFFQQVVQYPQSLHLQATQSSIPKVTRYEGDTPDEWTIRKQYNNYESSQFNPNKDVRPIVDKYFNDFGIPKIEVGNTTRPDIPISCPSSNCTWEPYETLGVCSECVDVADMLEFGCHRAPLDWIKTADSYIPYDNGTMCGWFFNATGAKPLLMSGYRIDPGTNETGEILTTRLLPLLTNLNRRRLFGGSINFKHIRNPITDFVTVTPKDGPEEEKLLHSIFQHEKPRAHECVLSMCVKTIVSSYEMADYKETVTNRFLNTTEGPFPWTQEKVNDPTITNAVTYHYFQDINIIPLPIDGQENATNYGASNNTAYGIITVFDAYLPSFGTRDSNTSKPLLKYQTKETDPFFREYTKNPWVAPYNISDHMESLATSLTNMMRSSSKEVVSGKTFGNQTLVEVRWAWLSLPLFLLVLTFIFLVATIVRTSLEKDQVGVWKNSAIATILYGLPDKHRKKLLASRAAGSPRAKAKMLHVRMLPTKDWRVSGMLFSPAPNKPETESSRPETPPSWS